MGKTQMDILRQIEKQELSPEEGLALLNQLKVDEGQVQDDQEETSEPVKEMPLPIRPIEAGANNPEKDRCHHLLEERSFNCHGIEDISFSTISTEIKITLGDWDEMTIAYRDYGNGRPGSVQLEVQENDCKIQVKEVKSKEGLFGFNMGSKRELRIKLPRHYKNNLSLKSISGRVRVDYLEVDALKVSTVSGEFRAEIIYANDVLFKSTSGSCRIGLMKGGLITSTVSGSVKVQYEALTDDINMKSVSGSIALALPKNSEFEVNGKSVSGSLKTDFPLVMVGSQKRGKLRGQVGGGLHAVNIKTTSGGLNIKKC